MRTFTNIRSVSLVVSLVVALSACSSDNSSPPSQNQQVDANEFSLVTPDNSETVAPGQNSNSVADQTADLTNDQVNAQTTTQLQNADWLEYQDSSVKLMYPPELILDQSISGVDAQFLDPSVNALGGNDNCTYTSGYEPGSSLIEQVDFILSVFFDRDPEPELQFLEVNGEPAARVAGNVTIGAISSIPSRMQVMYRQDTGYIMACFGLNDDDITGIFDSFTLLN